MPKKIIEMEMYNPTPSQTVLGGNSALAEAMRQINPDVVAAYPITPASHIVEEFSKSVADGKVNTEFVSTESEHSAMSACVGAAACGVRAMTATASQGLALMHEVLYNASGMRLPVVLFCGNRALSAPLSIHGDHSDSMGSRDAGWIQLYARDPQEAYDLAIQSFRIGEHLDVRTPVMICFDAFDVSHMVANVATVADEAVTKFLGESPQVNPLLDFETAPSYGTYTNPAYYFEFRYAQHQGIQAAEQIVLDVGAEYSQISGRDFTQHYEAYQLEDAETVIIILGSFAGIAREAVDALRARGKKVGLLRLRTYRPFPADAIVDAVKHAKNIAIFDRTMPAGAAAGPLFNEINAALVARHIHIPTRNFIYGIGQRDLFPGHVEEICENMKKDGDAVSFVNLRDEKK